MSARVVWRAMALVALCLLAGFVRAHTAAVDSGHNGKIVALNAIPLIVLDEGLAVLRDRTGKLSVHQVADPGKSGDFHPATSKDLAPGYTHDAIWVRFTLN